MVKTARGGAFADAVANHLAGLIEAEGYELVLTEFVPRSKVLRLFIDREGGVGVDDCADVSHLVGDALDGSGLSERVEGHYTLEVSSPGLDRPLTRMKDFSRFVGSTIEWVLERPRDGAKGRKKYSGELVSADEGGFRAVVEGENEAFGYDEVERAKLVPQF